MSQDVSALFKALAEENRLRILAFLLKQERCVCELETALAMTQSNVSRHLVLLKQNGILESFKKAQWTYYKISDDFKKNHKHLWLYLQSILSDFSAEVQTLSSSSKCLPLKNKGFASCSIKSSKLAKKEKLV